MSPAADAAALLWRAWQRHEPIVSLPPGCRPGTLADGWAIQRALDAYAGPAVGWKVAATSAGGQAAIGSEGPLVGPLYKDGLVPSPVAIDATSLTMGVAEAEFAFTFAREIPVATAPADRELVVSAIDALVPAVEVPGTRFTDFMAAGLPSMVADALCTGFLITGTPVREWNPDTLAAHAVTMRHDGEAISSGTGADVLGDPVDALIWAIAELHRHGIGVRAGDIVTTGACTPPRPVVHGSRFVADFGSLGAVDVSFTRPGSDRVR